MAGEPNNATDETSGIALRHRRLRGNDRLLFVLGADPKNRDYEPVCQQRCGGGCNCPCYYRASHVQEGLPHKFTSECRNGQ